MWDIALDRGSEVGLSQQIYNAMKTAILSGAIVQQEALPSTRELAKNLNVSRNTVCAAYDMLWTEGYILCRQGAPSHVADGLNIRQSERLNTHQKATNFRREILWDFKTGQPDLTAFPWKHWNDMIKIAAETLSEKHFAYSGPKGYEPLCLEISRWLLRARNMHVDPKDVFITSGSTQALHLLINILHREDHEFALENPSHPGIRTMIEDKGQRVKYVPVDVNGMDVAALGKGNTAAVYVTPVTPISTGKHPSGKTPCGAAALGRAERLLYHRR